MNTLKILSKLKEQFQNGENISKLLRTMKSEEINSSETIMISYDFQAGSYTKIYNTDKTYLEAYTKCIVNTLQKYMPTINSIMEVGVGEATTLGNVVKQMNQKPKQVYGFDISWSRIKYAKAFVKRVGIENCTLFTGNLFSIPMKDNAIDIVYTSHSLEPNGGNEKPAIEELYRIAKEYLVLLEPCYELASPEAQARMKSHGYITKIQETVAQLGYDVVEFRLFDMCSNPLNPTGLTIIKKKKTTENNVENPFACPITGTELLPQADCYFSKESLLLYPIVNGIPCLLPENAIIATHYEDVL